MCQKSAKNLEKPNRPFSSNFQRLSSLALSNQTIHGGTLASGFCEWSALPLTEMCLYNGVDTVDGRNPAPPGIVGNPLNNGIIIIINHHPWWCRILSINSIIVGKYYAYMQNVSDVHMFFFILG